MVGALVLKAASELTAPAGNGDDETSVDDVFSDKATKWTLWMAAGYESNIFEVNAHREHPTGAWFQDSGLRVARPLQCGIGSLAATFIGGWKTYFEQNQLDEYRFQPGLAWQVFDDDDTKLTLDIRGARFREPIDSGLLQRASLRSEPGWSGGAGWKWEKSLSEKETLTWVGGADYQMFDARFPNNLQITTKAELARKVTDNLQWTVGTNWDYQSYRNRLPDSEAAINPRGLQTLEGRGFAGLECKLGSAWYAEAELSGGYNGDLTNGYYDATVLAARVELRWEPARWKFKIAAEPEWVRFRSRPANLDLASQTLTTQQYAFEVRIDYAWSERVALFCSDRNHLQRTNADESRPDATLNRFANQIVTFGVSISF